LLNLKQIQEFPTVNLYRDGVLEGPYTGKMELEELVEYSKEVSSTKKEEL